MIASKLLIKKDLIRRGNMCIRRGNMCMRHDSIPNEYYEWRPSWASILTIQKGSLTADKWCIFNSQWLISRFVNTNYTVHVTMRAYIGVLIQSRDEAWFDRLSMCDWWQSLNLLSYKMNSEHIDISQNGDALFLTYSKPHQNLAFYTYLWQTKDIPHNNIHISKFWPGVWVATRWGWGLWSGYYLAVSAPPPGTCCDPAASCPTLLTTVSCCTDPPLRALCIGISGERER